MIGRGDVLYRTGGDLDAALLRAERDQARAVARVLAAELRQLSAAGGDAPRLLATLPPWVHDGDT